MRYQPLNDHLIIKPIKTEAVLVSHDKNYDEKGIVLAEHGTTADGSLVGLIVYFDSWLACRYNSDTPDEVWLVPRSAARAYEIPE